MELFWQALTIMTLGMILVFLFLLVVIQCMNLTAFLIRRYAIQHHAPPPDATASVALARMAAAIATATDFTSAKY